MRRNEMFEQQTLRVSGSFNREREREREYRLDCESLYTMLSLRGKFPDLFREPLSFPIKNGTKEGEKAGNKKGRKEREVKI